VGSRSLTRLVRRLWAGEVPLARAFWDYGIIGGTALNALTTVASMTLLALRGMEAAALVVFLLPIPYNVLIVIAVWRSASAYAGRPLWAGIARIAIIAWAAAASTL
jgi:hypothetical protein